MGEGEQHAERALREEMHTESGTITALLEFYHHAGNEMAK